MIKINLASRKQSVATLGVKTGAMTRIGKVSLDLDSIKDHPLRKAVLPIVVGALAMYTVDNLKETELQELDETLQKINAEMPRLQAEAAKAKSYEALKKQLEADEFVIRTKIETIQKLISNRSGSVKLISALVSTTPKDVWITAFSVKSSDIDIKGYSTGFNPISDFMKNLSENAFFADLNLKNSEKAKDETGLDVTAFELTAKRR